MYETLKIIHFLSLAVGIGTGVASMVLGIRSARATAEVAGEMRAVQAVLGRVALVSIVLMWITGLWLWEVYHGAAFSLGLAAKIVAVCVLTVLSFDLNLRGMRAQRGGAAVDPAYARRSGQVMMASSVIALMLAVAAFA